MHPILIAGMLQTLLQACGELPVIFYTVEIFESAGCQNGNVGTILVGVTQIIVIAISSLFIDRFGRKPLLIGSEVLMAVCLIGLGCFLYLKEIYVGSVENYGWFPIISLVGFIAAFAMGIGPIPFLVIGEVIAPEDKGMSSAVIIIVNRAVAFLVLFSFKYLIVLFGKHGCYWFFAGINLAGAVLIYIFVPETNGKSLEEIQLKLRNGFVFAIRE